MTYTYPVLGPHTPIVRLRGQFEVRDQFMLMQGAGLVRSLNLQESDEVISYPLLEAGKTERVWMRLPPRQEGERTLTAEVSFISPEVAQAFTTWLEC